MEEQWDLVISSLQDVYNANEVTPFDDGTNLKRMNFENLPTQELQGYLEKLQTHEENVQRAQRLLEAVKVDLESTIDLSAQSDIGASATSAPADYEREGTSVSEAALEGSAASPQGKCYWVSEYNPEGPLRIGSEVAYKPRKGGEGEWFQCEVVKISPDGLRFEVRDPEPDEMGNTGKLFKCNWKEIIHIPAEDSPRSLIPNYPAGTKVLARYPETTTFYPAIVTGTKRDGVCRLKFDGEEEVDKEMEVARRLVLPFPTVSSLPSRK